MWKKLFSTITLTFILATVCPFIFAQTNDDETIKVDVALVNIPVIVSDKLGRRVLDLTIDNFTLMEDGNPQKIEYLSTQNTSLSIVLLLDTSRSAQDIIERIKTAAGKFVQQMQPTDRCMIISFAEQVQVESEFTAKQTKLARAINNIVMSKKPGTLMQDAVFATVDTELRKIKGRKAIILITDGKDVGSAKTKNDLLYRLEESDTPIYSIFYETTNYVFAPIPATQSLKNDDSKNQPQVKVVYPQKPKKTDAKQLAKNLEASDFLLKMSEITAGRIFPRDITNLDEALKNVAEELRKQYLISYYPDGENYDVSKHQIKIKVDRPNLVVRTKSYTRLRR